MLISKNILIVTTVPETIRAFLLPQLTDLIKHGANVHVATGEKGCELPELSAMGVTEHRLPLERDISPLRDVQAIIAVIKLCRRYRFDIIHTHTLKASLVAQLGSRIAGVPVRIETAHGTRYMPDLPFLMRKAILWSERLAALQAHRVWVLNQEDYNFFQSHHLAKIDALQLLGRGGIGVDLKRFRPDILSPGQRCEYRKTLGIPDNSMVVGFVGRLVKDKGVRELIEAWPYIVKAISNSYLLIVTSQLKSERSREIIACEKLHKLPNATVIINRNDMPELFNCMNVLVLPSYREGFPCVILEASACGLPVIASDVRGCRDAVENGKTGVLIPSHNTEKLKLSVINLLNNSKELTLLSCQARAYAEKNFNQNNVIALIRKTYESLLEKKLLNN